MSVPSSAGPDSELVDTTDPAPAPFPGESRWPMALAVVGIVALTAVLPQDLKLAPRWFFPPIELVLLGAIVLGDPGRIDRRARWLQVVSVILIGVLTFDALAGTAILVSELVTGGASTDSAETLLLCGGAIWVNIILAFSLIYWELDGGGAAARFHEPNRAFDFAFPQQLSPEVAPPNWRPLYGDYLYVAFTSATALSPTDAMPLSIRAKFAMAVQGTVSLLLLALVIARAVNIFN